MTDLDEWLGQARQVTYDASETTDLAKVSQRIAREPTQCVLVAQHDIWRSLCCAALASLVTYTVIDRLAVGLLQKQAPTWVASPSAATPFELLIGQ